MILKERANMKKILEEKKFEKPEMTIVYFEGVLATDDIIVASNDYNDPNQGFGDLWPRP